MKTSITIRPDGTIIGILPENFDTSEVGRRQVTRLSDVYWNDREQGWCVFDRIKNQHIRNRDGSPRVFPTRRAAIDYEVWYMERNRKKVLKFVGA